MKNCLLLTIVFCCTALIAAPLKQFECSGLLWRTGGKPSVNGENVEWTISDNQSGVGKCLTSGGGGAGKSSSFLFAKIQGPGVLSFRYRVQTYNGTFRITYDKQKLIDYTGVTGPSAEWKTLTQRVSEGSHTLSFLYVHSGKGYCNTLNGAQIAGFSYTGAIQGRDVPSVSVKNDEASRKTWIESHEKSFSTMVMPLIDEMEYEQAYKKHRELVDADKPSDSQCQEWDKIKSRFIENAWAIDLSKSLIARLQEMEEDKKTTEDMVLFIVEYGKEDNLPSFVAKQLQVEKMGHINKLGGKFDESIVMNDIIKQVDEEVKKVAAGTPEGTRIRAYQRYVKMINSGRLNRIGSDDGNAKIALAVALENGHYFVADKMVKLNADIYSPNQVTWSPDVVAWCMTNHLPICKQAFDSIVAKEESDVNIKCLNSMLRYVRLVKEKRIEMVHWYADNYEVRRWGCGGLARYLIQKLSAERKYRFLHNVICYGGYFSFTWLEEPIPLKRFETIVKEKHLEEKFFKYNDAASYVMCIIARMQADRIGSISRDDGMKMLKLMLESGAPLNVKGSTSVMSSGAQKAIVSSTTPLQLAVMFGDKDVVELLLQPEWGANVSEEIDIRCKSADDRESGYVRHKNILQLCRNIPWNDNDDFVATTFFNPSQNDRMKVEKLLIDAGASE